ncbi:MAG: 30S ribosomal protein S16 [Candidatus Paceibacterota bacterium]|nr:30S ribosomal protein S16 [Candidatus Paceibacterota bacterium]MDD4897389.1 30S ribosomal protein S16 [Candidatus Paceibacterota bacterium]
MLVIRFFRTGKRNQPFFKVVVTDKRNAPSGGRFVESVGYVNPLTKECRLEEDRIKYWLSVGAKPSDTVHNLLVKKGIIEGEKIPLHKVKPQSNEEKKEEAVKEQASEEKKEEKVEKESVKEESSEQEKTEEKSEDKKEVLEKKEGKEIEEKKEEKEEKSA